MNAEMDIEQVLEVGPIRNAWKKRAYWIAPLILTASAAVVWANMHSGVAAKPVAHYRTELARTGDLAVTVTATGQLKPTRVVNVGSQVSGIIDDVLDIAFAHSKEESSKDAETREHVLADSNM